MCKGVFFFLIKIVCTAEVDFINELKLAEKLPYTLALNCDTFIL